MEESHIFGPYHNCDYDFGDVAQLGERLLCKQKVVGSIPSISTKSPL